MKNLKTSLMCLLSICGLMLQGQQQAQLSNYAPVSPNSASLGKYGLFPVNHNLGTVGVGVPIYTLNTGKQQLPIQLSYNTSGIKVNELAPWVGLGWTLQCGGAIIRNVKGRPGPYAPYQTTPPTPKEVVDLDGATFNEDNYEYLYHTWTNQLDSQPDEFVINAPGISGAFYFDEYDNGKAVFKDQTRARVTVSGDTLIQVTRADGVLLRFGSGLDGQDAKEISTQPVASESAYDYVSAWYLTEMIDPRTNDTISFHYKGYSSYDYPVAVGESVTINHSSVAQELKGIYPDGTVSGKKYLERIDFNNGHILFNSLMDREDLADEYRLDNIAIYSGPYGSGTLVDKYTFHHSYFSRSGGVFPPGYESISGITNEVGFGSTRMYNSRKKSLKLDSITIGRNGTGPSHAFEYNTTTLPLRGSTSQDHWGYANGNTGSLMQRTNGTIPYSAPSVSYDEGNGDREANEQKMKAGILTKIIYPTGGYTVFEYEPNHYEDYVSQTEIISGREYATAWGPPSGQDTDCPDQPYEEKTFTVPSSDYVSGSGRITISFSSGEGQEPTRLLFDSTQYNPPEPIETYPGSGIFRNEEDYSQVIYMNVIGTHTIKAYEYRDSYGANGVYDCAISSIMVEWDEYGPSTQVLETFYTGGLRVKGIKNYDGISPTPVSIKEYEYAGRNVLQPTTDKAFKKYFSISLNMGVELSTNLYYDNNLGGRPSVEYGLVTEYDIDPVSGESNGKTVYQYETVSSQRLLGMTGPTYFKHPQASLSSNNLASNVYNTIQNSDDFSYFRTDDWRYGYLKEKEVYKGAGTTGNPYVLVQKKENVYDELSISTIKKNYVFMNDLNPAVDYSIWITPDPNNDNYGNSFVFSYYIGEVQLGRKVLERDTLTVYDMDGGNPRVTVTDYFYDNLDHLQVTRTKTVDSKGEELNTRTYYPDDVLATSTMLGPDLTTAEKQALDKLKTDGTVYRIAEPVQTETYHDLDGDGIVETNELIGLQRTNFKDWDTELGLDPGTDKVLPVGVSTLKGEYNAAGNPMDPRVVYHKYDALGNPVEVSMENGPHTYYVWGYDGQYPIAKIDNLESGDIDTTIQNLIGATVTASNNDDDTCPDTGSCDEKALRTALANLRGGLPSKALMTSYTHDPAIGVTSTTDPSGYTMYYIYDDMNRLKEVRDADNMIISDYSYHYVTE